jgi:hypothetical protein
MHYYNAGFLLYLHVYSHLLQNMWKTTHYTHSVKNRFINQTQLKTFKIKLYSFINLFMWDAELFLTVL